MKEVIKKSAKNTIYTICLAVPIYFVWLAIFGPRISAMVALDIIAMFYLMTAALFGLNCIFVTIADAPKRRDKRFGTSLCAAIFLSSS